MSVIRRSSASVSSSCDSAALTPAKAVTPLLAGTELGERLGVRGHRGMHAARETPGGDEREESEAAHRQREAQRAHADDP